MTSENYDELREDIKNKFIKYYNETYHIRKGETFDCFGKDEIKLMEITINETINKILRLKKSAANKN